MDNHMGQVGIQAGPVSKIQWWIAAVTQSPAVHTALGLGDGTIISAQPGGVRIDPESDYPGLVWSHFPLTQQQAQDTADWARLREHRPYNWVDDGMIAVECLTPFRFPGWVTKHFDNDKTYQCSQFCDSALWHGGNYHVFSDGREPGRVAPASFAKLFQDNKWWPTGYWESAVPLKMSK